MRILPFRGYRFTRGGRDVSAVVAPPYDQIEPETLAHLQALSPWNIVRVTVPAAGDGPDPYASAAAVLARWLAEGAWTPDPEPALYPYEQRYTAGGREVTRTGFVALGEVTEYGQGPVRPHEQTHAAPKADRLRLLEATGADTGLLCMLVADPGGTLRKASRPDGEPVAEARDLRGELHRLWRISDPDRIARVQTLMASRSVIIADGHHRYETAVEYARRHPEARWKLMAFWSLEEPGPTILANHRLLRDLPGFALDRFLAAAGAWFEAGPLSEPERFQPAEGEIGVVTASAAIRLRLRPGAAARIPWPPGTSEAWRGLAVSLLHEGLLRPVLGIDEAALEARAHLDYTADQAAAVRLARSGRYQAAFLLRPTTVAELVAVVEAGERLPRKSTHFYPKLLDGLVFHLLDPKSRRSP